MELVAKYVVLIYGLLMIIGGIIGFTTARSLPSLLSGGISGIILLVVFAWSLKALSPALWTAVGISAALTVLMGVRFAISGKFMPSGGIALISLIALILTIVGALQAKTGP